MGKQITLSIVGVVVGVITGMIFMMLLHLASTLIHPLPDEIDFMSQDPENMEKLQEWMGEQPGGFFLLAAASHGLGCMFGSAIAMLISGRRSVVPTIIVGVIFTACGIVNLTSISHPTWFPFVDVPIYLVLALVAGFLLLKREPSSTDDSTEATAEIR